MDDKKTLSYKDSGVDIDVANEVKGQIGGFVSAQGFDRCVPINRVGAFASLVKIRLSDYKNPVFVLKSEEPGSKQLLSIENDKVEWISRDLINHLINDLIVTGAAPCAVLDTIICGKLERGVVLRLIGEMSKACAENGCILVGGETSEQPGVLPSGSYVLQASALGVVDEDAIIDGSRIRRGDAIVAIASNGLHTNGYSLVRKLIAADERILKEEIDGESFMDSILRPHTSYARAVGMLLDRFRPEINGMAHITGGGIRDNFIRILHGGDLCAEIDLSLIRVPKIFGLIKKYANVGDAEMLRTFNCGVGLALSVAEASADRIIAALDEIGAHSYRIGRIVDGTHDTFIKSLDYETGGL